MTDRAGTFIALAGTTAEMAGVFEHLAQHIPEAPSCIIAELAARLSRPRGEA